MKSLAEQSSWRSTLAFAPCSHFPALGSQVSQSTVPHLRALNLLPTTEFLETCSLSQN